MVNMAEEAKDPTHTVPRAILIALVVTTLLYALVSYAAVRAVPVDALASSGRPLVLVWESSLSASPAILGGIAVITALNGVLAQIVMAARVLFGLGRREKLLSIFYRAIPGLARPFWQRCCWGQG